MISEKDNEEEHKYFYAQRSKKERIFHISRHEMN